MQQLWGTLEPVRRSADHRDNVRYAHFPPGRGRNSIASDNSDGIVEPFGFGPVDENGIEFTPIFTTTTPAGAASPPPNSTPNSTQQKNPRRKMMTPITTAGVTQQPNRKLSKESLDDYVTPTASSTTTVIPSNTRTDAFDDSPSAPLHNMSENIQPKDSTTTTTTTTIPSSPAAHDNGVITRGVSSEKVASPEGASSSTNEDVSTSRNVQTTADKVVATNRTTTAPNNDDAVSATTTTYHHTESTMDVDEVTPVRGGGDQDMGASSGTASTRASSNGMAHETKTELPGATTASTPAGTDGGITPAKPVSSPGAGNTTSLQQQQSTLPASPRTVAPPIAPKRKCRTQRRRVGRNTMVDIGSTANSGSGCGLPLRGEMVVPFNHIRRPQKPTTANTKSSSPHHHGISNNSNSSNKHKPHQQPPLLLDRSAFYVSNPLDCDTAMFTSVMRKMRSVSPLFRFASWEVLKRLFDKSQVFLVCCTPPPQKTSPSSSVTNATHNVFQFHPPPTGLFYVTLVGHTELPPITSGWQKFSEFVSSGPKVRDVVGGSNAAVVNRNSRLRIAPKMQNSNDVVVTPSAPKIFRKSVVDETTCTEITRGEVVETIAMDESTPQQQQQPVHHRTRPNNQEENSNALSINSKPATANQVMTRSMRERALTPLLCRAGTAFWAMSAEAYDELSEIQMAATTQSSHFTAVASGTM